MDLFDRRSAMQVLGNLMKSPNLLDETSRALTKEDFPEPFHKIIFGSIQNLAIDGVTDIDYIAVDNFLSQYEKQYEIFNMNKGMEYLTEAKERANPSAFEYNVDRTTKFSLLRSLRDVGVDTSDIYNDKILSPKKSEEMQEKFDNMTVNDITDNLDKKLIEIKNEFSCSDGCFGGYAGEDLYSLKERLKITPEIGSPLCSPLLNTVFRGARLKKFYLRSSPTGGGKSRLAVADCTNLAVDEIYDIKKKKWVDNGLPEKSLFITTELEMEEIQTPMIAFVSGVQEDKILDGMYGEGEEERVDYAIEVIKRSELFVEHLNDFNSADIERTIQRNVLNNGVKYVFFDYIHLSHKMLTTVSQETKGMNMREDIILLLLATKLKDLCNRLGVFLMSSTQLNGNWEDAETNNQNLLRGSKAIADKLDCAIITLPVVKGDLEGLKPILEDGFGVKKPNFVSSVYKNRRGRWNAVKLWSYIDLGNCRTEDLFMTDNDYNLIPVEILDIQTSKIEDVEINVDTGEILGELTEQDMNF